MIIIFYGLLIGIFVSSIGGASSYLNVLTGQNWGGSLPIAALQRLYFLLIALPALFLGFLIQIKEIVLIKYFLTKNREETANDNSWIAAVNSFRAISTMMKDVDLRTGSLSQ